MSQKNPKLNRRQILVTFKTSEDCAWVLDWMNDAGRLVGRPSNCSTSIAVAAMKRTEAIEAGMSEEEARKERIGQ